MGLKSQAAFEAQAVDFLEKDEMRLGRSSTSISEGSRIRNAGCQVFSRLWKGGVPTDVFTVVLALLILIVGSDS